MVDHRPQESLFGAVIPAGAGDLDGPPGRLESTAQFVELTVGDVERLWP
jgi:hypothetical protein